MSDTTKQDSELDEFDRKQEQRRQEWRLQAAEPVSGRVKLTIEDGCVTVDFKSGYGQKTTLDATQARTLGRMLFITADALDPSGAVVDAHVEPF